MNKKFFKSTELNCMFNVFSAKLASTDQRQCSLENEFQSVCAYIYLSKLKIPTFIRMISI